MSQALDPPAGQPVVAPPVAQAPSESQGLKPHVDLVEQGTVPVPGPDVPVPHVASHPRSKRTPGSRRLNGAGGAGVTARFRTPNHSPVAQEVPGVRAVVQVARLAAMIIKLWDKHWTWAERTNDNVERELRLLTSVVFLSVIGACGLALAAGVFVSVVMVTAKLTGIDPGPATTFLLSVAGVSWLGLVGVRAGSKFRR